MKQRHLQLLLSLLFGLLLLLAAACALADDTAYAGTWDELNAAALSGKTEVILTANIMYDEDSETVVFHNPVTLRSAEGEHFILDGYQRQILRIEAGKLGPTREARSAVYDITFQNGLADETADAAGGGCGGALYVEGGLLAENCIFLYNWANSGGAIYANGAVELTNCVLRENTATAWGGGAVTVYLGGLALTDTVMTGNSSLWDGGAAYISSGRVTAAGDTQITNNHAQYGGGLCVIEGDVAFSGGEISGNTASQYGGGVYAEGGTVTLTGTSVTDNTANLSGGGLYVTGGRAVINGGCLKTNTALRFSGGGAYADDGVQVADNEITGNTPDDLSQ